MHRRNLESSGRTATERVNSGVVDWICVLPYVWMEKRGAKNQTTPFGDWFRLSVWSSHRAKIERDDLSGTVAEMKRQQIPWVVWRIRCQNNLWRVSQESTVQVKLFSTQEPRKKSLINRLTRGRRLNEHHCHFNKPQRRKEDFIYDSPLHWVWPPTTIVTPPFGTLATTESAQSTSLSGSASYSTVYWW